MERKIFVTVTILLIYLTSVLTFASAILVSSNYVTIYPGEEESVKITVDNNENSDIEDVSVSLVLSNSVNGQIISLPFSIVGSSTKDLDDLNEDDDDSASFTLKANANAEPGNYNIPYTIKYKEKDGNETGLTKEGSFGLMISAKTDLDFSASTKGSDSETAIVGKQGKISLEIINRGLGDIKAVSIDINPQGYDLISKEKIFIGTINPEDSDSADFDVIFKSQNPTLTATISYKDFNGGDQTQTVTLPLKVYTSEEALELGLISKSKVGIYIGTALALIIIWYVYRRIKKRKKKGSS